MTAKPRRGDAPQKLVLAANARVVLERRYLAKDDAGQPIETPEQLFRRVADNIAQAERLYTEQQASSDKQQASDAPTNSPSPHKGREPGDEVPADSTVAHWADAFYDLMTSLRFLPNSPTLGNAGRPLQQLAACFVLPVEDSMASIFESVKDTALIHQSGGGTGFGFSRLRPAGDIVRSTGGVASGPVSFMRVFDSATEAIKQGGTRRGANMAILDVHHPDIEAFINVKADMVTLTNFNISVAADEAFMRAVEADTEYDLVNPRTGQTVERRRARDIFDQIVANAWRNGDPGLVFLDRINADNPTPALGRIEATNPCGEQPLLPYEACNLGSLNLARFVTTKPQASSNKPQDSETVHPEGTLAPDQPISPSPSSWSAPVGRVSPNPAHPEALEGRAGAASAHEPADDADSVASPDTTDSPSPRKERGQGGEVAPTLPSLDVDWDALAAAIPVAVRFLDNVIDMNAYPVDAIAAQTRITRKIGLGVMGWADMLYQLDIPYDSEAALDLADRLTAFIRAHADAASEALAAERGPFPAWPASIYGPEYTVDSPFPRRERGPGGEVPAPEAVARMPRGSDALPMPRGSARGTVPASPMPRGTSDDASQVISLRNATRTTVAPTGTLSIIADCSGGIEPAFALAFTRQHFLDPRRPTQPVRLTEVNPIFEAAAREQGFYSQDLVDYLAAGGSLQQRPDVPDSAKRRFVTAHEIAPEWHVRMQAAFQRHVDNAVSKTINFPRSAAEDDIAAAYLLAYHEGCKGITIYRDGSRTGQVLSHVADGEGDTATLALEPFAPHDDPPHRRHLPDERDSLTHKFRVGEQEGYVTAGLFADGTPGEIFVTISKEGSTIRGLMDSVAMLTSYSLQYGVPLRTLVDKFRGVHFEPAGLTSNPQIPSATSLVDYIFRWLELRFLKGGELGTRNQEHEVFDPDKIQAFEGHGALEGRDAAAAEQNDGIEADNRFTSDSPSPRKERGTGGEVSSASSTAAGSSQPGSAFDSVRGEPGSPDPDRGLEPRNLKGAPTSHPAHLEALEGRAGGASDDQASSRRTGTDDDLALRPGAAANRPPRARRAITRGSAYIPPRPALPFAEIATGLLCPDCGSEIVFAEGCLTCRSCGYTRCG